MELEQAAILSDSDVNLDALALAMDGSLLPEKQGGTTGDARISDGRAGKYVV